MLSGVMGAPGVDTGRGATRPLRGRQVKDPAERGGYGWRVNTARHPRSSAAHVKWFWSSTLKAEDCTSLWPEPAPDGIGLKVMSGPAKSKVPVSSSGAA